MKVETEVLNLIIDAGRGMTPSAYIDLIDRVRAALAVEASSVETQIEPDYEVDEDAFRNPNQ